MDILPTFLVAIVGLSIYKELYKGNTVQIAKDDFPKYPYAPAKFQLDAGHNEVYSSIEIDENQYLGRPLEVRVRPHGTKTLHYGWVQKHAKPYYNRADNSGLTK